MSSDENMDIGYDFSKSTDKDIKSKKQEWYAAMFTSTDKGADINSIMTYTPLIQLAQNELTGRFVKRTTILVICIAVLSLIISFISLSVGFGLFKPGLPRWIASLMTCLVDSAIRINAIQS